MDSSDSSDEEFFDAPTVGDELLLNDKRDDKGSLNLTKTDLSHQSVGNTNHVTSSSLSTTTSISTSSSIATATTLTTSLSSSSAKATTNDIEESNYDSDKQQQHPSSNDASSSTSGLPKPPPRRKKKPTIMLTKSDSTNQNEGDGSHGDQVSDGSSVKNVNTCLTFLVDEIKSIQGDLSVNHDFPIRVTSGHYGSFEELSSVASDQQSDKDEDDSPDVTLIEDFKKRPEMDTEISTTPKVSLTAGSVASTLSDVCHLQSIANEAIDSLKDQEKQSETCQVEQQQPLHQEQKQTSQHGETDDEAKILEQITILNKDTGECRPLSQAEDILPKCINPLNPHLSKLANDYQSDEDETHSQTNEAASTEQGSEHGSTLKTSAFKNGVKKLGKFGHGFIKGVKGVRGGGPGASNRESIAAFDPRMLNFDPHDLMYQSFKLKTNRKKDVADFEGIRLIQELNDCRGAIWCMKWSSCGQLLAVAGQDQLLRVYCSHKSWKYFTQLRSKASGQQISPNSTKERSLNSSRNNSISSSENVNNLSTHNNLQEDNSLSEEGPLLLFSAYRGHTADVLDISWSKNNFLLSSSMDKTVKLWHITRVECLCTFCHKDFVTTINFHPRDDRYFLSGSLDGVLRLWNIPDKRLTLFNEVMAPTAQNQKSSSKSNQETSPPHGLITASAFVENGKFAVIGTYDGRVIFYSTDQLKYSTQIHVSGGKNISNSADTSERKKKRNSNKVTGIEGVAERKILVTTNDSRIRLYDLRDLSLACKYKGCVNYSSQIRASVSPDNQYIVCGSENSSFYIWRTREETTTGQRRDRNAQWECVRLLPPTNQASLMASSSSNTVGSSQPKNQPAIVTSATFAPNPSYLDENSKYVIAIADFSGSIKLFSR